MKKITYLAILLSLFLTLVCPLVASAELISHEISSTTNNPQHGDDHNVFYAQGIYWAFSFKYFYTSTDNGVTWSGGTDISGGNVTFEASHKLLVACIDESGTYVYVAAACKWNGSSAGAFRRGELYGNGTIGWTDWSYVANWQVDSNEYIVNVNIAVDGTGHYWIGETEYHAYTTNTSYGKIIGSSTTDGTWTTDVAKSLTCYQVGGYIGGTVMPVGLSSTALVLYSSNNGYIYGRKWQTGSTTWSSAVNSVGTCRSYLDAGITEGQAYFSAVPYMDRWAQIVYNRSSDNYLIETYYDSDLALFADSGYEHQMQTATSTSTWPCISVSSISNSLYVWWVGTPLANHLYVKSRNASLIWQSVVDLGEESAGFYDTWHISAIDVAGEDALSVIYKVGGQKLRFNRLYGNETGALPYGIAIDATDVTATSATLNALCTWSGGSGANATFVYQSTGYAPIEVDMGSVSTSEYFDTAISGLVPDNLHWFYIRLENESGNYSSNTKFFMTLETAEFSAPTVLTGDATFVTSTTAQIDGTILYDGGLDCYGGFDVRVLGASSWTRNWYVHHNVWPFSTTRPLRSLYGFYVQLSNLSIDTTYEYRALAKNSLTEPSVVYGAVKTFTTGHVTVPTPTGGGIIPPGLIPPGIEDFFRGMSAGLKLILAIIINIVAIVVVTMWLGKSKGVGIAALATGVGFVILFVSISWYPLWIILLIGAIVALLIFFIVLGRK